MLDAKFGQPSLPDVELTPFGHRETDVIEPGTVFVEPVADGLFVLVQADDQAAVVVPEHDHDAVAEVGPP
jgi:hypothetical protein